MKTAKNPRALSDQTGKTKYISGSGSPECQTDEDNEIIDSPAPPPPPVRSTPVLSVYDQDGARAVLNALPATFGRLIDNKTQVGQLANFDDLLYTIDQIEAGKVHL